MTKIKYEGEVKSCRDCPFHDYAFSMDGPKGDHCRYREVAKGEYFAYLSDISVVDKGCPFLKKQDPAYVYKLDLYAAAGAGDLTDHVDTLYFKNREDAVKLTDYWNCMDIPETWGEWSVKKVRFTSTPRDIEVIDEVPWEDKGEALYNLSGNFRYRADKFWPKYPSYMPEWYKK